MKKIIYFLGIVFLSSIIILNLKYTAFLDNSEHIIFYNNSWLFNLEIVLVVIVINYIVSIINKKLNKKERSIQKKIVIIALLIYLLVNILWVIFVNPKWLVTRFMCVTLHKFSIKMIIRKCYLLPLILMLHYMNICKHIFIKYL